MAARETVRFATASREGLRSMTRILEESEANSLIARNELEKVEIQRDLAELGAEQAELSVEQARRRLAVMLNLPVEQAERLELRATLRDHAPPPARERLHEIALVDRPDLAAFRMGVGRGQADVRLAEAEKYTDLFMLWSPWELRNNQPTGGQNATSWSVAAFGSVPIFNRNQGNIRRAQVNVTQTQTELAGIERQVLAEVDHAYSEYSASRTAVDRIEQGILPRRRRWATSWPTGPPPVRPARLTTWRPSATTTKSCASTATALIRHRRAMLRLNTAVARRVLP